jgi:CheY-like chemotaxis protein
MQNAHIAIFDDTPEKHAAISQALESSGHSVVGVRESPDDAIALLHDIALNGIRLDVVACDANFGAGIANAEGGTRIYDTLKRLQITRQLSEKIVYLSISGTRQTAYGLPIPERHDPGENPRAVLRAIENL